MRINGETAQFPTDYQRGRALVLVSAQQQQRHMNKRNESRFNRCIGVLWFGAWSIANERPNREWESGLVSKPEPNALTNSCCIS